MGDGKTIKVEPVKAGARTDQELMAHLAAQVSYGPWFFFQVICSVLLVLLLILILRFPMVSKSKGYGRIMNGSPEF